MPHIITNKYNYIDEKQELYLGHAFTNGENRALDKRCDYCGKWITCDLNTIEKWGSNVKIGYSGWPEKIHCGSEHCQDYHNRVIKHEKAQEKIEEERMIAFYSRLKKRKIVA